MTDDELLKLRTVCRICGRTLRHLGAHLFMKHGMTSRQYKQELGVHLKIPLTDPDVEQLQKRRRAQDFDLAKMLALGVNSRFKPLLEGESRPRYVSRQFREEVGARNSARFAAARAQ